MMTMNAPSMATGPDMEDGEDMENGLMTNVLGMAIGLDTTKIRTGDGLATTNVPGMEEDPDTEDGLDTEMMPKTDTDESTPAQARSAVKTKQHGSSSKKASIRPDWPNSSLTIKT
jgi:hypothetical protein